MKRKLIIGLSLLCFLIIGITAYIIYKSNNYNIIYESYGDNYFKDFSIELSSISTEPKIDKSKIRKIAENKLKTFNPKPKRVYLEYRVMSTKTFTINTISQEAIAANPLIQERAGLVDIPVWIITFDKLLPVDYINDGSRGKQPLDVFHYVVDAATGKDLVMFGSGRKPQLSNNSPEK